MNFLEWLTITILWALMPNEEIDEGKQWALMPNVGSDDRCDQVGSPVKACSWNSKRYYNWHSYYQTASTCMAHATSYLLELSYALHDQPMDPYAIPVQQVIDCFYYGDDCGTKTAESPKEIMDKILKEMAANGGILLKMDLYPRAYDGKRGKCVKEAYEHADKRKFEYLMNKSLRIPELRERLFTGSFITGFMVRENFRHLKSGGSLEKTVYKPYEDTSSELGLHMLNVVAWRRKGDATYFLVKNSWEGWGWRSHSWIKFRNDDDTSATRFQFGKIIFWIEKIAN